MPQALEAAEPEAIVIAGRRFVPTAKTTFDQDLYMMSLMTQTGLDEIVHSFDPQKMELTDVAARCIAVAYESGKLFLILGAGLLEEGTKWSKERSIQNAEFLASLDESADKEALHSLVATVILGFFLTAISSSKISQSFGNVVAKPRKAGRSTSALTSNEESLRASAGLETRKTASPVDAEPETSGSGTTSSGNSPATTPTSTTESSTGR
jgi:hypothetical protein